MAADAPFGEGWDDLVKVAVLGTARLAGRFAGQPLQDRGGDRGMTAVLASIRPAPGRSPERSVLAAAAALGVARKAATPPVVAPELPAPAALLDGRPVPSELAAMMPLLLADGNRPALTEVVERCAALGMRLPAAVLPIVLDLASAGGAGAQLREILPEVAGARGRWLAERNPRWAWLLPLPPLPDGVETRWDLGTTDERLGLLRALRAADPPRATELLLRTWGADRAPERATFVAALGDGLSMADEPFLEEVGRSDRAKEVRQVTCRLLDRLPESRRAERMASRVDSVLSMARDPTAPFEVAEAWVADGIEPARANSRRAVGQVIEAAPLDHWGPDVRSAIDRVTASDSGSIDVVLGALGRAAVNQRRDDWILSLLAADRREQAKMLLRAAPVPRGATWLAGVLAKGSALDAAVNMDLAHSVARPWPAALVAEVLRRGVDVLSYGQHLPGDITVHLRLVGERADPSLLQRLVPDLAAIRTHGVRLERAFREAHAVAHLRLTALALLDPPSPAPGS